MPALLTADVAADIDIFDAIRLSPIAGVVTDPKLPENPIVCVNEAFCTLTGYSPREAEGRNCRFLAGPATEPECQAVLRTAVLELRPALTSLVNYRKDGSTFRNAVMIAPHFDEYGELAYFVGSQMDVSEDEDLPLVRVQRAKAMVQELTPRQREILREITLGYRSKQIAGRLGISEKTVKMHRAGLLMNLGVRTSADAVRIAVEAHLQSA